MSTVSTVAPDLTRTDALATSISCSLCQSDNVAAHQRCRVCHAPMVLSVSGRRKKDHRFHVGLIGSPASGKTVYMGMLCELLSRQATSYNVVESNTETIDAYQRTIDALLRSNFPPRTSIDPANWDWACLDIMSDGGRKRTEVTIPDFPGDSLMAEIERPATHPSIRGFFQRCDAILLMLDTPEIASGNRRQDVVAMKALSYLKELQSGERGRKEMCPLAVVFSKADSCELVLEDPQGYARSHTPGVWKYCREHYRHHEVFACRVTGATSHRIRGKETRQHFPLRIEPDGVIEPFEWLCDQLNF